MDGGDDVRNPADGSTPDASTADAERDGSDVRQRETGPGPRPIDFAYRPLDTHVAIYGVDVLTTTDPAVVALETLMRAGFDIEPIRASVAELPPELAGADLIVLSPRSPLDEQSSWIDITDNLPVVSFDGANWLPLGFVTSPHGSVNRQNVRVFPTELTQGYTNTLHDIYLGSNAVHYGEAAANADVGLVEPSNSSWSVGFHFPASRDVAFGLNEVDAINILGAGLIRRALYMGLGVNDPSKEPPRYECQLVTQSQAIDDFVIHHRAERNLCDTSPHKRADSTVEPFDPQNPVLWMISPTTQDIPDALLEYEGPVVVMSPFSTPAVKLKLLREQSVSNDFSGGGAWTVSRRATDSLVAGQMGDFRIAGPNSYVSGYLFTDLAPDAIPIAHLTDEPDRVAYWVVEPGGELVDGSSAAGPRAVLSIPPTVGELTAEGLQVIDAALQWAMAHDSR